MASYATKKQYHEHASKEFEVAKVVTNTSRPQIRDVVNRLSTRLPPEWDARPGFAGVLQITSEQLLGLLNMQTISLSQPDHLAINTGHGKRVLQTGYTGPLPPTTSCTTPKPFQIDEDARHGLVITSQ